MLVDNKRKCQVAASHQILGKKEKDGSQAIEATASFTLLPGQNEVPVKDWRVLKQHPMIKQMMEHGELEEPQGEKESDIDEKLAKMGPDAEKHESVRHLCEDVKPKEALQAAGQTIDKDLLERWLAEEKRADVKKAIKEQLEKLDPKPEDFRDKKED